MEPSDVLAAAQAELQSADDVLMTVKEYAQWRRVHVQTVYSAIRYGRLQFQVERATAGAIRIMVPRGSIRTLKIVE